MSLPISSILAEIFIHYIEHIHIGLCARIVRIFIN